jgi:O-antigen ligase
MPHYSVVYMADPEIAFRNRPTQRRAHSLYLEMAAETGVVGLIVFLAIPAWLAVRLWFLRRYWSHVNEERALLASAFLMALIGYFGTAVFLHLAYQRYYWLLLGLTGAAVHLLSQRSARGVT